jgi:hypothetical protein
VWENIRKFGTGVEMYTPANTYIFQTLSLQFSYSITNTNKLKQLPPQLLNQKSAGLTTLTYIKTYKVRERQNSIRALTLTNTFQV